MMEAGFPEVVALLAAIAFFYTMGGFAGGGVFLATLLFWGVPPAQAAVSCLIFNIASASSSLLRWRIHIDRKLLWLLTGSIPAAFFGGSLLIPDKPLEIVMGAAIALGGAAVLFSKPAHVQRPHIFSLIFIGAAVGLLAGLTGIGGGVYLAPILLLSGISEPKTTAATTTAFILLNSVSGQLARLPRIMYVLPSLSVLLAIPVIVAAAQLGSYLGAVRFRQSSVRKIIGLMLVAVGAVILLNTCAFF